MAMSMTGYGRGVVQIADTRATVEVRSVNHRFLDISATVPRSLFFLEDSLKKRVQSMLHRGRIDVHIEMEGKGFVKKTVAVDWDLMDQYVKKLEEAKSRYRLTEDIPVTMMTTIPDLMSIRHTEQQPDDLEAAILEGTQTALNQLIAMRKDEGDDLQEDLKARIQDIRQTVLHVQNRRKPVIEEYRQRIQTRIDEYLSQTAPVDEARLHQEIALLAEKGDITEEITRLLSHVDHFKETLQEEGPIGRKLDFIVQEMLRETNTIGSKSNDEKISEWTVLLKSNLEKIKEQVQNIE